MRKILSYFKSHIYDIHSLMVGVFLVMVILFLKKPLRKKLTGKNEHTLKWKIILLLMLFLVAIVCFALVSLISPFVDFSLQSGIMSAVYALCGNAFIEQVMPGRNINDKN